MEEARAALEEARLEQTAREEQLTEARQRLAGLRAAIRPAPADPVDSATAFVESVRVLMSALADSSVSAAAQQAMETVRSRLDPPVPAAEADDHGKETHDCATKQGDPGAKDAEDAAMEVPEPTGGKRAAETALPDAAEAPKRQATDAETANGGLRHCRPGPY